MHLRALHIPAALLLVAITTTVSGSGCIAPADTFDEFGTRLEEVDQGATAAVSTGLIAGCIPPGPDSAVAGTYIFALSAELANTKPIFLKAEVTFGDPATAPSISMRLTPLATPYVDTGTAPFTEVPPALEVGPFPLDAQGKFVAALPLLSVGGAANAITGSDLEATIKLESGQVCEVNEGQTPGIICGNVSGDVSKPIDYPLAAEKNFYAMTKYDGDVPTDPTQLVFDCSGRMGEAP